MNRKATRFVLVAALAVSAACGRTSAQTATAPSHAQSDSSAASNVTASVTPGIEYSLPAGDQTPSALAGDPQRRGVWFLTGSDKTTSIVFVSVNRTQDHVYGLPRTYGFGATAGIAIAGDGSVWAGISMVLFHLSPSTGAVTTYQVPSPDSSAVATSYEPSGVGGTQSITALAVSAAGTVALAIHDASQVVVFKAGRFTAWSLPMSTIAKDVAYLSDGTLGVSLSDFGTHDTDRVATFTPDGARHESTTVIVSNLVSTGATFVTVGKKITVLDADAKIVTSLPLLASTSSIGAASVRPLGMLPGGDLVMASADGVMSANPATGRTRDTRLAFNSCLPYGASIPVGTTLAPMSSQCPQIPVLLAADGAGDIWLTLPQSQSETAVLES